MEHITVGRTYNEGKVAFVECVKDGDLKDIHVKDECFLLIFLSAGSLRFRVAEKIVEASAPCFFCFDETVDPVCLSRRRAEYFCIYFHPRFLNINMTFDLLRSRNYEDIAFTHDMFLLKPFTDGCHVVPVCQSYSHSVETACAHMQQELQEQRDWYWSCRGRSYFMEVIIALERMYGLIGYGEADKGVDSAPTISDGKLRAAVLFIESHYMEDLSLLRISTVSHLDHTTLTRLFRETFGVTAMEYLMQYRIHMAKKQLAFTEVPIKDIARRCGFKTVQHFSRVFRARTEQTPGGYRHAAVQKRKEAMQ